MAGIAQNGQKRLIFIVVPQVKTKMREKGKQDKKKKTKKIQGKYTNIQRKIY